MTDDEYRAYMNAKPIEHHEHLYRLFFSAWVSNEEVKHEESLRFTERQIASLLAYGKVTEGRRLAIEAEVYRTRAWVKQLLDETLKEVPDTSHSTTRH